MGKKYAVHIKWPHLEIPNKKNTAANYECNSIFHADILFVSDEVSNFWRQIKIDQYAHEQSSYGLVIRIDLQRLGFLEIDKLRKKNEKGGKLVIFFLFLTKKMFGNLFSNIAGDCKAMLPFIFTGTYKEIIHNLQGAILLGYLIFYYYYPH